MIKVKLWQHFSLINMYISLNQTSYMLAALSLGLIINFQA